MNGMIYQLSGDFTQECYDLFECQTTIGLADASTAQIDINLFAPGFNKIGYGRITGFAACVKADEIDDNCPPDSNFEVISESVWADSTLYMARLEMINGTPPYQFVDNDAQKFYHTQWGEDVFYLGVIPDSVDLNLSIYDVNGCQFDIASISRPVEDFDTEPADTTISAIQNLPLLGTLDIFPTIFSNKLTVQFEEPIQGLLTAYNLTGQTVATWDLRQVQNQSLDVGQLPTGNYVFALETEEGVYTRLAIKE